MGRLGGLTRFFCKSCGEVFTQCDGRYDGKRKKAKCMKCGSVNAVEIESLVVERSQKVEGL